MYIITGADIFKQARLHKEAHDANGVLARLKYWCQKTGTSAAVREIERVVLQSPVTTAYLMQTPGYAVTTNEREERIWETARENVALRLTEADGQWPLSVYDALPDRGDKPDYQTWHASPIGYTAPHRTDDQEGTGERVATAPADAQRQTQCLPPADQSDAELGRTQTTNTPSASGPAECGTKTHKTLASLLSYAPPPRKSAI